MDWVINNKEWEFSGVGIPILGTLLWVFRYFGQRKFPGSVLIKSHTPLTAPQEIPVSVPIAIERISLVTPNEIQTSIESAPPLQKEVVAQRYVGQQIEWDTELSDAKQQDSLVRLQLKVVREPSAEYLFAFFAWCSVKLDDYPELAILPEKTHIRINGTITDVSVGSIGSVKLDKARLIFPSLKNVA